MTLSLESRSDIIDVVTRYSTGIDRRDWALFRTCFTDDCECDYGPIAVWHGVDEITDWMEVAHREMGHTLHRLSNIVVDGDEQAATARTYVDAVLMAPDGVSGHHAVGFYDDDLVRTDVGWRIAKRSFTMAFFEAIAGVAGPG